MSSTAVGVVLVRAEDKDGFKVEPDVQIRRLRSLSANDQSELV